MVIYFHTNECDGFHEPTDDARSSLKPSVPTKLCSVETLISSKAFSAKRIYRKERLTRCTGLFTFAWLEERNRHTSQ